MFATTCYRITTIFVAVACAIATCGNLSHAEELKVLYRNDTELTATLPGATIDWVTVSKSGKLIDRKITLAEIKSLTLSRGRSSELLAKVRQNITRLGDADFVVRENAELDLENQGGQFKNLLKQMEDSPSMEVRHRISRLIENFSKRTYPPLSLDTLILTNGRTLEGEARDFSLTGDYRGAPITLDRNSVAGLFRKKPAENELDQLKVDQDGIVAPSNREAVKTEIFHRHTDFFTAGQLEFDFDTDRFGKEFKYRTNVENLFANRGLLLRNEADGNVGISTYPFSKILPGGWPVGGRSLGLYNRRRGKQTHVGVMEIRFCVPGKPNLPAGVKEVGLFIARVKHSRDIIMEAYNAQGNVLATVEATDQQCVFAGVKSNEPITRLRIFSNPWLAKLSRKIDKDFAIDTLRMSAPIAVESITGPTKQRPRVKLTNGDSFSTGSINTTGDGELLAYVSGVSQRAVKFTLKQDELASIQLSSHPVAENSQWKAMLEDGSVVNVSPGKTMTSQLLGDKFSKDDLVGLWKGSSPARYPVDGDWKSDQALVVFPTCRIQSDPLKISDRTVSWTVENKIEQTLMLGREDPKAPENQGDPTPSETSFAYANRKAGQLPTFWNRQPRISAPGPDTGVVELTDGQRFFFGDGKAFQFAALKNREIQLTWMEENPVNIPLKNVRTIIFPKK